MKTRVPMVVVVTCLFVSGAQGAQGFTESKPAEPRPTSSPTRDPMAQWLKEHRAEPKSVAPESAPAQDPISSLTKMPRPESAPAKDPISSETQIRPAAKNTLEDAAPSELVPPPKPYSRPVGSPAQDPMANWLESSVSYGLIVLVVLVVALFIVLVRRWGISGARQEN